MTAWFGFQKPEATVYRGADKFLAWPGRKQATTTKLQLLQTTQKKIQKAVRPTRSPRAAMTSASVKMATLFFFSRVGLRTCQHPCI